MFRGPSVPILREITTNEINFYKNNIRLEHFHFPEFFIITWKNKEMAVDHFYFISFLMFRFPCTWKVASLFCHTPSSWMRARSSPSLTQSIICRERFWYPHLLKCCPSSVLMFSISCLWPPCLTCMKLIDFPVYCFPHLQVMRYTQYLDLHVRLCLMWQVSPV